MLLYKYTTLNTVTKSSSSNILLLIALSRVEAFPTCLLAFKKIYTYPSVNNTQEAIVFQE